MTISCLEIETAFRPDKSECKKKGSYKQIVHKICIMNVMYHTLK